LGTFGAIIIATGHGLGGRGSFPGRRVSVFILRNVQTDSGGHPGSYPIDRRAISCGIKRPGRETDHSPPSSAEVKNGATISPLLNTSSWRDA
jgi:hypothetical protein